MTNIFELSQRFKTRKQVLKFLKELRFPNGVFCPRCGSLKTCTIKSIDKFQCLEPECKYMFSVTCGTIFHGSHIPLQKWILACFLICNAKKGISAKQIQRDLQVTYKTAWYLMHRIRRAMKDTDYLQKLSGIVEMDETWLGGSIRRGGNKKSRIYHRLRHMENQITRERQDNYSLIIGAVERSGRIRAKMIPSTQKQHLRKFITANISQEAEMVITDEHAVYKHLKAEYNHQRIHHQFEYVRGQIYTNTIENFWSILKRGFVGVYHKMSPKYIPLYLSEFTFRHNQNGSTDTYKTVIKNGLLTDKLLISE
ncbi:MAG TPA: IS1595 family transposase [candidate division Zixibacteria bacterium]|nr:IS1595 family transposase [candidate division Zixibacteria bacterium]